MASLKTPPKYTGNYLQRTSLSGESFTEDDNENIPYHARDYASPFTYGNLPKEFKTSDLFHVAAESVSPLSMRKPARPSISPSRPVIRKTPTREEFEEMLMQRREQTLNKNHIIATQQAQNASIQKDLDELQQTLNENILQATAKKETEAKKTVPNTEQVGKIPAIDNKRQKDDQVDNNALALVKPEAKRPETPAFPNTIKQFSNDRCISPYPLIAVSPSTFPPILQSQHFNHSPSKTVCAETSLNDNCNTSATELHDVAPHLVKFAKDSSEFWYKPHISREETIALLRNAQPGTFIIRNSTTYKNAYGLVIRVEKPPQGLSVPENSNGDELVRHFLLEPTHRGVRLKGCTNEPVFTSLSALVYQHSINKLALPCKLLISDRDLLLCSGDAELVAAQKLLLKQGAACNVLYIFCCDMESLTGDEAIRKALHEMYSQTPRPRPTEVHLKVSQEGITLTDNSRRLFFRRHYTPKNISYCAIDPENGFWSVPASDEGVNRTVNKSIFAFVARPTMGAQDNQCHVFCDLAANQPASAIVSFANKVLPMDQSKNKML